jgi:hypothetical protein
VLLSTGTDIVTSSFICFRSISRSSLLLLLINKFRVTHFLTFACSREAVHVALTVQVLVIRANFLYHGR